MKRMKMALAVAMVFVLGVAVFGLSACGRLKDLEETPANGADGATEISDSTDETWETQNEESADSDEHKPTESEDGGHSAIVKEDDKLEIDFSCDYSGDIKADVGSVVSDSDCLRKRTS